MTEPTDQKQPETESKSARSSGAGIAVLIGLLVLGGLGLLGSKALKPAATTLATPRSATDAEQQENLEGTLKFNAARSIMGQADLEAWQAAKAATGATTFDKKYDAWKEEMRKQTMQHPDESSTSLSGQCELDPGQQRSYDDRAKNQLCEWEKLNFRRNYWFALQSDHRAQKYLAFCFADTSAENQPCSRIAQPSEIMSCAWSLVAISSGSPLVEADVDSYDFAKSQYDDDVNSFYSVCEEYNAYVRDAVRAQASALFSQIYHKPLPGVLPPRSEAGRQDAQDFIKPKLENGIVRRDANGIVRRDDIVTRADVVEALAAKPKESFSKMMNDHNANGFSVTDQLINSVISVYCRRGKDRSNCGDEQRLARNYMRNGLRHPTNGRADEWLVTPRVDARLDECGDRFWPDMVAIKKCWTGE